MRLYDYAASANCYKVRLALAQLELRYERVPIDIFAGDTLTDDFGRLNPASHHTGARARRTRIHSHESTAILLRPRRGHHAPARPIPASAPRSTAGSSSSRPT